LILRLDISVFVLCQNDGFEAGIMPGNFFEKLAGDLHSQRATASISSFSEERISQEYAAQFRG
jgi:hypothetical protein